MLACAWVQACPISETKEIGYYRTQDRANRPFLICFEPHYESEAKGKLVLFAYEWN